MGALAEPPRPATARDREQYYARRAREYERIYDRPERQAELAWLRERIPRLYRGRTVLEVACGTGYWTQHIARAARHVHAFDINEPVLEIARAKPIARERVTFHRADAISFRSAPSGCDAAFAGFWWSHVPKSELPLFVKNLSLKLAPGSLVGILDNAWAAGSSTPVCRTDEEGNTYQRRKLADGAEYEVLKNFPSALEMAEAIRPVAAEATLETLTYYWLLVARLR